MKNTKIVSTVRPPTNKAQLDQAKREVEKKVK